MTLMPIGIFFSVVLSRGRGGAPSKGGGWLVVGRKWPNLNFKGKEFLKGPHTHTHREREREAKILFNTPQSGMGSGKSTGKVEL